MSAAESVVLNMDDIDAKRALMSRVGALKGLWEVTLKARKKTRSLDANRYYWAAVVTPWLAWLRESDGDPLIDKEQAHEALKAAVLGTKSVASTATGGAVRVPPRTRGMKSDEFAAYVEAAAKFLAEFCGIVVLPSEMFLKR